MSKLLIRPHHIFCMQFFEGKGYSKEFCYNMKSVIEQYEKAETISLTDKCDCVCEHCPNNIDGLCKQALLVKQYDCKVLKLCSLEINKEYSYEKLKLSALNVIKNGQFNSICSDCEWHKICESKIRKLH